MFSKKLLFIAVFVLVAASYSDAQTNSRITELQTLEKRISENSSIDEIKETISKAEKIFETKDKNQVETPKTFAQTALFYAHFRRKVFDIMGEKINRRDRKKNDLTLLFSIKDKNAEELEKVLKYIIQIYADSAVPEDIFLAEAKFELARLSNVYFPINSNFSGLKSKVQRIKKAQDLYLQSLIIKEKLLEKNDDSILSTLYLLAESFSQTADYEKALPFCEKFISGMEAKYGENSEWLLPALEMSAAISEMLDLKDSAAKRVERISKISGENSAFAPPLLFLTPRIKSFEHKGINGKVNLNVEATVVVPKDRNNNLAIPKLVTSGAGSVYPVGGRSAAIVSSNQFRIPNAVKVLIVVSKEGKVLEAEPQTDDKKLAKEIRKNVFKWEFNPLNYKNTDRQIKGYIYYSK